MSSPHEAATPVTAAQVDTWLHTINEKRFKLYPKLVDSHVPVEVFCELGHLLQVSGEGGRVIGDSLRDRSHMACGESAELRAHAAQLMEQCTKSVERMAQLAPRAEEAQEAETLRCLEHRRSRRRLG